MRFRQIVQLLPLLMMCGSGCGKSSHTDSNVPMFKISGKVFLNDLPLEKGQIRFIDQGGELPPGVYEINNGEFTGDIPPGVKTVRIYSEKTRIVNGIEEAYETVAPQFNQWSKITATVTETTITPNEFRVTTVGR